MQFGWVFLTFLSLYNMPSSMHYWEKLEGSDDSFAKLFQTKFKAPDDHSSSCSIKSLSIDEIHSSDPSLRSLKRFEIDQLRLPQGYDHACAMEKLSAYGPQGFLQSWEHDNILFGFPPRILGKKSVVRYLEEAFLNRAMCGVLFPFSLATGLKCDTLSFTRELHNCQSINNIRAFRTAKSTVCS